VASARNDGDFYGLPEPEQIARLQQLGRSALAHWKLGGAEIAPAAYRENMTFRVDAGARGRFALRIHQAHYRTDANIRSELAFMQALGKGGVRTPDVVPAKGGELFVLVSDGGVPEARQCDLFEWIDGRPLREAGVVSTLEPAQLAEIYGEVGRQAAAISHVAETWPRPPGFSRPAWDAEGIFGERALLGDFRKLPGLRDEQRTLLADLAARLDTDLAAFGKTPDRYGLCHGDFLPENIMVCADGIRLIDFDDCGESWHLFEFATAVFDLLGEPPYQACVDALVAGYREHRELPDAHLEMLPSFMIARALSYLGWSASRTHLKASAKIVPRLLAALEAFGPAYLASRS
jgi:Ser/Thr protein kinase RdoA (MazF antagonist)